MTDRTAGSSSQLPPGPTRLRADLGRRLGSVLLCWQQRSAAWTGQQRSSLRVTIALVLLAVLVLRSSQPSLTDVTIFGLCLVALFLPYLVGPRVYTAALVLSALVGIPLGGRTNDTLVMAFVLIGMAGSQLPVGLAVLPAAVVAIAFALVQVGAGSTGLLLQMLSWFAATFAGTVATHIRRVAAARQTAMLAELQRANAGLRLAHEQLRLDSQRAAGLAAAEERERIAREIHDVLAHTLTILAVQVGAVKRLVSRDPERAQQQLELIAQLTRDGLAEVRRSVHALHSPDEEGTSAMAMLVDGFAERTGTPCTFAAAPDLPVLPPALSKALYRVTQEALTNAVRHGNAQRIEVRLTLNGDHLVLAIEDDGVGAGAGPPVTGGGNGLPGAGERLRAFAGTLDAQPRPAGGFGVCATVPLAALQVNALRPAPGNALPSAELVPASKD